MISSMNGMRKKEVKVETALKLQAEKIHVDLNLETNFMASDRWMWCWQKRHGISQTTISGEAII